MAAAFDTLTGRRGVDIGTSFTRAWNERTGKTTKRSKDYPNPEYYSLRYNFKPESIDNEGAGTLTPKPGADGHVFELERPSTNSHADSYRFTAVEQPSKEWECVLLWDPATQQLTLEKLESTLNLTYDGPGKGTGTRPASATPPSSAPGPSRTKRAANNTTTAAARDRELELDLEKELIGYSDAEGEPDDDVDIQAEISVLAGVATKEEEEEEEEMELVDVEPPPPPPPVKPKPAPRAAPKAAPKAKPKPRARPTAPAKKEKEVDGIEEEELTFGEPTRRTRRPRRASTNGPVNTGLALPAPPPQNRHAPPTPSDLLQPPSTSSTQITYAGSDSGSESDESDDGGQEAGEVDAAALERELELELALADGDEDEGMEDVTPIADGQHNGRPLSLNELFGEQSQGDDDTSSDDSDDD